MAATQPASLASTYPVYLDLYERGILRERVAQAQARLSACTLCPRVCHTDRLGDQAGECRVGRYALVYSAFPHFGEESVLRGWHGSGTVFFSGCNLRCVFCQNHDISQTTQGEAVRPERLTKIFLDIQEMGCHNLNLVTPSHVVAQILEALELAIPQGLRLPIVYNTSGYDSVQALKLLAGIVDIYMPDLKYSDSRVAMDYSGVRAYWEVARKAIAEMHRQVGDLTVMDRLARRGLLIRHLVLPEGLAGTRAVLAFIAALSQDSWVNLMDQYRPAYRAFDHPELARPISRREYQDAVAIARHLGIHRGIPFDALS
ncbi:MAG: radical SAM protein [Candidatus Bipolaricaulia bacterium]